ncbi:hypothetical protein JJB09_21515 [Rhizobium sp. KVB221]|uniref:Uncharacterized protein n=1 Tax=Rhizobium setariae TaxID=2801340 RepID=A0A936YPU7_9HYPH|nr:hypothetical protein [Rhizobium setariae]MBL0374594.1 hypothetical protein [Rhizobium setariae]
MSPAAANVMPPFNPPFWYGSFAGLWVYYVVDVNKLNSALASQTTSFRAFDFGGGKGLVNINFMTYAGHSGENDPQAYIDILKKPEDPLNPSASSPPSLGVEASNECEFSIVCYPQARQAQVPFGLSVADFIAGNDHTKTLGSYRMAVPCDDRIAVYWGKKNFGETKVMTHPFLYNVPTPNNTPAGGQVGQTAWLFTVPGTVDEGFEFNSKNFTCAPFMFSLNLDCSTSPSFPCNASEIVNYSTYPDTTSGRPVGSRRNMFGSFVGFDFSTNPPTAAQLTIGNSTHPLGRLMRGLLGSAPSPVAAQVFQSQPVIAESSPYYVDL